MFSSHQPVLQPGAVILVTGVSGFIGSHVADQLLAAGYTVRGTTRDAAKNAWLADKFAERYGKGRFELHGVPDMAAEEAFDRILDGESHFSLSSPPLPSLRYPLRDNCSMCYMISKC